jgi:hypothetical protein
MRRTLYDTFMFLFGVRDENGPDLDEFPKVFARIATDAKIYGGKPASIARATTLEIR